MTDPPPPGPEDEPPRPEPERPSRPAPQRGGGSVVLGIVAGVLFFAALVGLNLLLAPYGQYVLLATMALIIAYIVAAAVLAGRPRRARFGAGLLIAIGVSILLGAGVCVALFSTGRLVI